MDIDNALTSTTKLVKLLLRKVSCFVRLSRFKDAVQGTPFFNVYLKEYLISLGVVLIFGCLFSYGPGIFNNEE